MKRKLLKILKLIFFFQNNQLETTDRLPTQAITRPHYDHQSGPQAQTHDSHNQTQLPGRHISQTPEPIDFDGLGIPIEETQQLLNEMRSNLSLQRTIATTTTTTSASTATDQEQEISQARDYWNSAPPQIPQQIISTTKKPTFSIATSTSTPNVIRISVTDQPCMSVPLPTQNRIDNPWYFLWNDINEELKKSYNFFINNIGFQTETVFLENLNNLILDNNNQNQKDFGEYQSVLIFCKNKLDAGTSAASRDQLEKLKTNLIKIKFFLLVINQ
ncbi:hypothetical protein DDB_G0293820 [Dictyostelium discoideum AX4]|uniref:Uncharacterized protein n=1 Tax=Dictyostelium discoideum TaxID=44689 RepID=Q54BA3_DICDI|nr:hypothetical protein DDB_G0293820 [Dictyostelium discoideum AX4]EAL60543.1 hypothetical protein DDB_G0293820 [Dictyostelium discoideum AX4]|eukprot:XP_628947.1 hypothetical protein DDB_G0293820 [Dictyostelium discoideum AX4]